MLIVASHYFEHGTLWPGPMSRERRRIGHEMKHKIQTARAVLGIARHVRQSGLRRPSIGEGRGILADLLRADTGTEAVRIAVRSVVPGVGDEVTVHFNLKGRAWNEKFFGDAEAWKIEVKTKAAPVPASEVEDDEIPF